MNKREQEGRGVKRGVKNGEESERERDSWGR